MFRPSLDENLFVKWAQKEPGSDITTFSPSIHSIGESLDVDLPRRIFGWKETRTEWPLKETRSDGETEDWRRANGLTFGGGVRGEGRQMSEELGDSAWFPEEERSQVKVRYRVRGILWKGAARTFAPPRCCWWRAGACARGVGPRSAALPPLVTAALNSPLEEPVRRRRAGCGSALQTEDSAVFFFLRDCSIF